MNPNIPPIARVYAPAIAWFKAVVRRLFELLDPIAVWACRDDRAQLTSVEIAPVRLALELFHAPPQCRLIDLCGFCGAPIDTHRASVTVHCDCGQHRTHASLCDGCSRPGPKRLRFTRVICPSVWADGGRA